MPFLLAAIIIAIISFNSFIPLTIKAIFYAISLTIKSFILFLLPIIIFSLLFNAMLRLSSNATKIIGLILAGICISNYLSTFVSHLIGMWIYKFKFQLIVPKEISGLAPFWNFEFPKLIANDKAMFAGLIIGIVSSKFSNSYNIAKKLNAFVSKILDFIIYLIPFFIAGFVIKLQHDGIVASIIKDYALIFVVIAMAQFSYVMVLYLIANNFVLSKTISSIKNILPAALTGFSTMSSAAAMPFTIKASEKNCKNKDIAYSVIPTTVNIHLIGDCFAIPIFAYAILKSFGISEPSLINYLIFALYFVLAKFSVAAIPAGGILVMLPILETYLNFTGPMMSLITALYILFDPVITCINVLGNGAFAMIIDKSIINLKNMFKLSYTN
jgi:hypothetical protein